MQEQKEFVFRRWVEEVWGKGSEKTIEELFDENGIAEYPTLKGASPIQGVNQFKKLVRWIRGLFNEIDITIEQIAVNENKVLAVCNFSANRIIHKNGKTTETPIKVTSLCQAVIEDGKIVWMWNNINLFGNEDVLVKTFPD